jgi:hypothetical protein
MISQQSDIMEIASIGYYIPESTITSSEISKLSGIPQQVFKEKISMEIWQFHAILSQLERRESNHDRGTIHPQPEVWGLLYPRTPTR